MPVREGSTPKTPGSDIDDARRWMRILRRVDRVEVAATTRGARCEVFGVGHRLPVRRRIPFATAIALRDMGIPVVARR